MNPEVVNSILYYLYTFDYRCFLNEEFTISYVLFHVHVHIAADQFDLSKLGAMAASNFGTEVRARTCFASEAFARAVELVYTSDPDRDHAMRDQILDVVSANMVDFYTKDEFAVFRELTSVIPAFNLEFAGKLVEKAHEPQLYSCCCFECGRMFGVDSPDPRIYHCVECGVLRLYDPTSQLE